jgi:hypothetical protein
MDSYGTNFQLGNGGGMKKAALFASKDFAQI